MPDDPLFASTSFNVYVWHCPIFMAEMVLLDILGVSLPCTYGVMAVFVVVVELLAIPLYLFVEKPLAKYMKNMSGKTCVLWTRCDAISDKK